MNNHEQLIDGLGLWSEVISKNENLENRPALFLDRDGTIVSYEEFLHDPLKIKINSNICSLIKAWNNFNKTEIEIRKQLSLNSAHINMLCACAFHKDAKEKYKIKDHFWRKPNSGMLEEAKNIFNINFQDSWIIGDNISDIQSGLNVGLKGGVLYNNGDKAIKSKTNFTIKYADQSHDLEWLVNEFI